MATALSPPLVVDLGRSRARVMLVLFALTAALLVAVALSPLAEGFANVSRGPGDLALYAAEVERVHAGENFYDAAAAELAARGYPMRSPFNWRTPLPVWLIGQLPELRAACVPLAAMALVLVVLSFGLLADEGGIKQGALGVLLLSGALLPCFLAQPILLSELWSGVLLATSAVCFGRQRRAAGIAAGIAALFFRELAAPYCLICIALAASERRFRELAWWGVGLAGYAAFYAFHLSQVGPRIPAGALAHEAGWLRLGGAGFLISTAQMNTYLLLLPQWVTALYLAAALLGAATWNTPAGRLIGLTVAAYTIAFAFVGNDFNQYWGCQIAPLLCLTAARAPSVLGQEWRKVVSG